MPDPAISRPGHLDPAPFHAGIADADPDATARWLVAGDGTRLRAARLGHGPAGTVLLFPGRTEFVEKYGPAGRALAERGLGCVSIDWRGQGLSDRLLPSRATGHVERFSDYQRDVEALILALPTLIEGASDRPLYLLGHSMGGAIGLRALLGGLPARGVVFTGPMWGIRISPFLRPLARTIAATSRRTGFGLRYAPGTEAETYVAVAEFEGNTLTGDPEMFAWMQAQVAAHPELALGGPSMTWLHEALGEIAWLRRQPLPPVPCLTLVGEHEQIVDVAAIRRLMSRWPGGRFEQVRGARHEIMMETPSRRSAFFDGAAKHFSTAT